MPQLENGYLRIANELMEEFIKYGFSSRQWAVIMAIARMTYGYNKKSDALSGWQISKLTGIDRSHVSKTLSELISLNIINRHEEGRFSHGILVNEISINKNYETWLTVAKKVTVAKTAPLPKNIKTVAELATQPLPKQPTHKDIPKDNTKDIYIECLNYLNEKANRNYKPVKSNLDFIKARFKEGYTKDDIFHVIDVKSSQWLDDEKMNQFLRPATLFNATKFSQYFAEKKIEKIDELTEMKRKLKLL